MDEIDEKTYPHPPHPPHPHHHHHYTDIEKIMLDLETKIDKNAIHLIKQNTMYNGAY